MAKIIPFPGTPDEDNDENNDIETQPFDRDLGAAPEELLTLVSGDPDQWARCFTVQPVLTEEEIRTIPGLVYARALLQEIRDRQPLKGTAKGNLPAAMVKELAQGAMADADQYFTSVSREDHSPVLGRTRRLVQDAGLLSFRSTMFRLTKIGSEIIENDDNNQLYRRLLTTGLVKPQRLEEFDGYPPGGITARTIPLLLHAVRNSTDLYEEDLSDLLYSVFGDSLDTDAFGDELDGLIRLRFFDRFGIYFGLLRKLPTIEHPLIEKRLAYYPFKRWERTPLFDRAFQWSIKPPVQAFQTPRMAAYNQVGIVHEQHLQINGTRDYRITGYCLRAIERCPSDADAYVILARLYQGEPELVLSFADEGLKATEDQEPEVPPGIPPWEDHLYRDVLRLHFIRAETLLELNRTDEGFRQFEGLLKQDPQDGMGAALWYVPALIQHGSYDEAARVHRRYCRDAAPDTPWTDALLAWASGDREAAKEHIAEAVQLYPLVPDALLRRPLDVPDTYQGQFEADDALLYTKRAEKAWRRVKGAIEWLRRTAQSD
jgi:tetratricopeptide (TPR) repeat protein